MIQTEKVSSSRPVKQWDASSYLMMFTEGEFDFILVLEGDSEQIIAAKGGPMMSDDFDGMISIKAVSVDSIRKNLKQMQSSYTTPSSC